MSASFKKFFKRLTYISTITGIGITGVHLYNKKVKKDNQSNLPKKNILENELKAILKAENTFIYILLNEDSNILNEDLESVFELKSMQYALDIYYKSRKFKSEEIKDLTRLWLLNNTKILEGYLQKIDIEEVYKSINNLDKSILNLKKTIIDKGMHNYLPKNSSIQEQVIETYTEIKVGVEKNIPIANYIYELKNNSLE